MKKMIYTTRPKFRYNEKTGLWAILYHRQDYQLSTHQQRAELTSKGAFVWWDVFVCNEHCLFPNGVWRNERHYDRAKSTLRKKYGTLRKRADVPAAILQRYDSITKWHNAPKDLVRIFLLPDGYAVAYNRIPGKSWQCLWIANNATVTGASTFYGNVEMWRCEGEDGAETAEQRLVRVAAAKRIHYPTLNWPEVPESIQRQIIDTLHYENQSRSSN